MHFPIRTPASKVRYACIFFLGDDQKQLTLPQAHLPVANSCPPFSIAFSRAQHSYFAQPFSMNRTQIYGMDKYNNVDYATVIATAQTIA